MHLSGYRMKRKCGNPACPDCYPEKWDEDQAPGPEPSWAWPWSVALLILLAGWAVWFVTSGAVRP